MLMNKMKYEAQMTFLIKPVTIFLRHICYGIPANMTKL